MELKHLRKILAAALFVASFGMGSSASAADDKVPFPIAVVDVQVVMEKSPAVGKIREQVDKKAEIFKNDSVKKEEYFKKKIDELEKQKSILAKDVLEKKERDIETEQMDFHKKVQENRSILEKGYNESMQKVIAALNDIVKDEAKRLNAKLILHKQHAIFSDDSLDITDKVIDALNKKLPSVEVKF